jgi:hypothetical protein
MPVASCSHRKIVGTPTRRNSKGSTGSLKRVFPRFYGLYSAGFAKNRDRFDFYLDGVPRHQTIRYLARARIKVGRIL